MRFFVKAIATGFALSMGGALFKKVSKKMGLDEGEKDVEGAAAESAELDLDTEAQPET